MNLSRKKIGIWGYGIMGKSAVDFFLKKNQLGLFDQKSISANKQKELEQNGIIIYHNLDNFFANHDIIIPSSGIDLHPYKKIHHKIIPELDLFAAYFHKPIIAITGTLGKTTITEWLGKILTASGLKVMVGGNIGVGLFDLIDKQNDIDYAIIEVSSFQLEYCQLFAPDLAIWTNFYPNHLDRHASIDEYFKAKTKILSNQKLHQKALIPLSLILRQDPSRCQSTFVETSSDLGLWRTRQDERSEDCAQRCAYFSLKKPSKRINNLFFIKNSSFYHNYKGTSKNFFTLNSACLFPENWLIVASALKLLNISMENFHSSLAAIPSLEHRLEKVATINNVTFYNDSKATVPEATLAALQALGKKPILLFLGGLSKGIDREPMIKKIKNNVKKVYCFGKEAELLYNFCKKYSIEAESFANLDKAFYACKQEVMKNDNVLFSPSGASFDLFNNYQERGQYFKNLIEAVTL